MKIVGLRVEKYIGQEISGHNCDFEYTNAEFEKHIICCTDKVSNGETEFTTKFEIEEFSASMTSITEEALDIKPFKSDR